MSASAGPRAQRVLVIGNDELTGGHRSARCATPARASTNLRDPTDAGDPHGAAPRRRHRRRDLARRPRLAALALVVEGVRPGVPLVVTVFDRDVASRLEAAVRNVRVMSMADIVAPSIAAAVPATRACCRCTARADGLSARCAPAPTGPRSRRCDLPRRGASARICARCSRRCFLPYELSAKILLGGLIGFFAILLLDALMTMAFLHESLAEAIYSATKTIVTVGPNAHVDDGPELVSDVLRRR